MMTGWDLPEAAKIGGREYAIATDYRDILDIIQVLEYSDDPQADLYGVLDFFYEDFEQMPPRYHTEAVYFLFDFIRGGLPEPQTARKLMDWQQDAPLVIADINRVAGCEIRSLPTVHWLTFLAWFGAIGEGQLSNVVGIRNKRARGKKLDDWEQEFYRSNRALVDLKPRYSDDVEQEKAALLEKLR